MGFLSMDPFFFFFLCVVRQECNWKPPALMLPSFWDTSSLTGVAGKTHEPCGATLIPLNPFLEVCLKSFLVSNLPISHVQAQLGPFPNCPAMVWNDPVTGWGSFLSKGAPITKQWTQEVRELADSSWPLSKGSLGSPCKQAGQVVDAFP